MKPIVLTFLALLACAAAADVDLVSETNLETLYQDETINPLAQGIILNRSIKKALKNLFHQLPCGFPNHGIPPLAPYTNEHFEYQLAQNAVEFIVEMIRFRFDGLNDLDVKTLKITSSFSKKVKFHFVFNELKASAQQLNTNSIINFLEEFGFSLAFKTIGPFEFALQNLSFEGEFKYKMPLFWGSIKISNLQLNVHLGGVSSKIGGPLGDSSINAYINSRIENEILSLINNNEQQISEWMEQTIEPYINTQLAGKKAWYIFNQLTNSNPVCEPNFDLE